MKPTRTPALQGGEHVRLPAPEPVIPPLRSVMADPEVVAIMQAAPEPLQDAQTATDAPQEPEVSPAVAAVLTATHDPENPWHFMPDAMRDGSIQEGIDISGRVFNMMWRQTSRHNGWRWVPHGFWSDPMNRQPIKDEPVAWRVATGRVAPGAIMA